MRVRLLLTLAAVGAAALVAVGSAGAAQNSNCPGGILASGNYLNVVVNGPCVTSGGPVFIQGNLTVNGGGSFFNQGGFVGISGNVAVFPKGELILVGAEVGHSVSSDRALSIYLIESEIGFVGGNGVLIHGGGAATQVGACSRTDIPVIGVPLAFVQDSAIAGNVTIDGAVSCANGVTGSTIGGGVTFTNNRSDATSGGNAIGGNTISGNLFCRSNQPPPIADGFGLNTVGGTINPSACLNLV